MLWERTGYDRYGDPVVADPVELRVRWEEKQDEYVDDKGTSRSIDAVVTVRRYLPVNSLMWEGRLVSYSEAQVNTRLEVTYCEKIPDLKGRVTGYWAGLTRFRDTNPADPSSDIRDENQYPKTVLDQSSET